MKRIVYFMGLKIAEIGGGFIVYYLLCLLFQKMFNWGFFWAGGYFLICFVILSAGILFLGDLFVQWNWGIAKNLADK